MLKGEKITELDSLNKPRHYEAKGIVIYKFLSVFKED